MANHAILHCTDTAKMSSCETQTSRTETGGLPHDRIQEAETLRDGAALAAEGSTMCAEGCPGS
eukprot:5740099-Pyramimonas_sp.AAC.1